MNEARALYADPKAAQSPLAFRFASDSSEDSVARADRPGINDGDVRKILRYEFGLMPRPQPHSKARV